MFLYASISHSCLFSLYLFLHSFSFYSLILSIWQLQSYLLLTLWILCVGVWLLACAAFAPAASVMVAAVVMEGIRVINTETRDFKKSHQENSTSADVMCITSRKATGWE